MDLNSSDSLSIPRACNVRRDVLQGLMRHPSIRTCRVAKKFVLVNNFVVGVCSICKTTTPCQCRVHVMSVVMYLEVGCDTQTFELAVMGKFLFRFWLEVQRGFGFEQL